MKNILLITCLILFSTKSWTQEWTWGIKASGDHQFSEETEIDVDNDGNIVIAGYYQKSLKIDTFSLYTEDDYYSDIYLCRINRNKKVEWLKHIEAEGSYDYYIGLTQDDDKNIYITGANNYYIFISKFDSLGNLLWNNKLKGNFYGYGREIALDQFDNIYIVGGEGSDFFMAKFNYYSDTVWTKQIRTNSSRGCYLNDLAVDAFGNIYFAGVFGVDSITIEKYTLYHNGGWGDDTFWGKIDTNGKIIWVKSSTGRTNNKPQIVLTADNHIYVSGAFYSQITFENTTIEGICCQEPKPYIAKYDTSGQLNWAKAGETTYEGKGVINDLTVDYDSNIYLTGSYFTCYGTFCSENDFYVEKYNKEGIQQWRQEFKMGGGDYSQGIDIDNNGYCYLVGYNNSSNFINENTYNSTNTIGVGQLNTFSTTNKRTSRPIIDRLWIICQDSIVPTLKAKGENIKWYDDPFQQNLIQTGAEFTPNITSTDTFYVTQTQNDIESWPKETIVHFSQLSSANLFTNNDTLFVTQAKYFKYQWYWNGDSIKNSNRHFCIIDTIGTYSVKINEGFCEKVMDTIMIPSLIQKNLEKDKILIFPNPTKDIISIILEKDSVDKISLQVINIYGAVILEKEIFGNNEIFIDRIDLSSSPKGLYLFNLIGNDVHVTRKILHD